MKPTFFKSVVDLRRWFDKHHVTAPELQVGFHKKALGRGITYPEALDEALCFGWIDSIRRGIDAESYTIRFTPRRPRSNWSAVNIQRVQELLADGRMKPSGLKVFYERKTQPDSCERDLEKLEPALDATLRANPKAASFFDAQPPGYRKTMIAWVLSAKKEETRARRFAHLIERSASGSRIDLLNPNRKLGLGSVRPREPLKNGDHHAEEHS